MKNRVAGTDDDSSSSSYWTSSSDSSTETEQQHAVEEPLPKKARMGSRSSSVSELKFEHLLKADYKWNIPNFNQVSNRARFGDIIESPPFAIGKNDELIWRLELYPRGVDVHSTDYVSVFLRLLVSKEPKVRINYKLKMYTRKGDDTLKNERDFVQGDRHGFDKFRKTDLVVKSLRTLDSTLTVSCEIIAELIRIPSHRLKVLRDLEGLLENGRFNDVVLNVKNTQFKVHKYILASRSPVFGAMFDHDMKEKTECIVNITDVEPDIMKELIRFAYVGEVSDLDSKAIHLLAAADKYAFEDLKVMCELSLAVNLNTDNVVDTLNFAEMHSPKLKTQALNYLISHIKEVTKTPAFKTFANEESPLLAEIICGMAGKM